MKEEEKIKDCNISRSIFGSTLSLHNYHNYNQKLLLRVKNCHNLKAAASRNLLLYDYYIKLYLLVLHTYEYVLQQTHSKKNYLLGNGPSFPRFKVSTCLAVFSSDQSKSMPPVLTDMMSHTDKGIDELFFYKTTLSLNQSQFSPIHLLLPQLSKNLSAKMK